MTDSARQFAEFVQLSGLDPSVVPLAEIKPVELQDTFGPGTRLRPGETVTIPGRGVARFIGLKSGRRPIVEIPPGCVETGNWDVPASEPDLAPVPATAAEYWQRRAVLARKVASIDGRMQLSGGTEFGWLPVMERALDAILRVMTPTDVVEITAHAAGGGLYVSMRVFCDGNRADFIRAVGHWVEAATLFRCAVFGIPGWYGPVPDCPWMYTLSEEARSIDGSKLFDRVYPSPPSAVMEADDA